MQSGAGSRWADEPPGSGSSGPRPRCACTTGGSRSHPCPCRRAGTGAGGPAACFAAKSAIGTSRETIHPTSPSQDATRSGTAVPGLVNGSESQLSRSGRQRRSGGSPRRPPIPHRFGSSDDYGSRPVGPNRVVGSKLRRSGPRSTPSGRGEGTVPRSAEQRPGVDRSARGCPQSLATAIFGGWRRRSREGSHLGRR